VEYDKFKSPVGWYVGSYLLRFIELRDPHRNDPERRFLSWENTVLVRAKTFDEAYAKIEAIGKQNAIQYRGGDGSVPVKWQYLGITDVLPIYEKLVDGAEIAWAERKGQTLKKLRTRVKTRKELQR
jgi:hypothetical protein